MSPFLLLRHEQKCVDEQGQVQDVTFLMLWPHLARQAVTLGWSCQLQQDVVLGSGWLMGQDANIRVGLSLVNEHNLCQSWRRVM